MHNFSLDFDRNTRSFDATGKNCIRLYWFFAAVKGFCCSRWTTRATIMIIAKTAMSSLHAEVAFVLLATLYQFVGGRNYVKCWLRVPTLYIRWHQQAEWKNVFMYMHIPGPINQDYGYSSGAHYLYACHVLNYVRFNYPYKIYGLKYR